MRGGVGRVGGQKRICAQGCRGDMNSRVESYRNIWRGGNIITLFDLNDIVSIS
jgi:hypothetical protein